MTKFGHLGRRSVGTAPFTSNAKLLSKNLSLNVESCHFHAPPPPTVGLGFILGNISPAQPFAKEKVAEMSMGSVPSKAYHKASMPPPLEELGLH